MQEETKEGLTTGVSGNTVGGQKKDKKLKSATRKKTLNPKKDKLNSTTNQTFLNPTSTLKNEATMVQGRSVSKKKTLKKKQKSSDVLKSALSASQLR